MPCTGTFATRGARFLPCPFVSRPFLMCRFAASTGNLALLRVVHRRKSAFCFGHRALRYAPHTALRGARANPHVSNRLTITMMAPAIRSFRVSCENARYRRTNGATMSQTPQSTWKPLT